MTHYEVNFDGQKRKQQHLSKNDRVSFVDLDGEILTGRVAEIRTTDSANVRADQVGEAWEVALTYLRKITMTSEKLKISGINAGVSGEYFVAAELTKRGYIASITLRNTKGIDILATNSDATRTANVQVKTKQGKGRSWVLNEKAETYFADRLFYVFVNLRKLMERPEYFIVPSKDVASFIQQAYATWLVTPGKKGQKHNDTTMRKFHDPEGAYLERWDLLGLEN